jgi:hypothetical protein
MGSQITDSRSLRDLVHAYRIGYTIQSSDVDIRGRVAQVTFHLELSGYHDGRCDDAFCLSCNHALRVLFEIADALRPIERDAFERAGYGYAKRAHVPSGRERYREVALGLDLTIRRKFPQARGGWGWGIVERIRAALTELGCEDRAAEEFQGCPQSAGASSPIPTLNKESVLAVEKG